MSDEAKPNDTPSETCGSCDVCNYCGEYRCRCTEADWGRRRALAASALTLADQHRRMVEILRSFVLDQHDGFCRSHCPWAAAEELLGEIDGA